MKEIKLTQGQVAIVDDDDYEMLSQHKWYAYKGVNTFYACRKIWVNSTRIAVIMHREILGASIGEEVDHINRNGLDNRKENIRICTHSENAKNRIKKPNTASKYNGVSWFEQTSSWRAKITDNRNQIQLGYFNTEEEAAMCYNLAAIKYHGEFANLNKIQ